MSKTKLILVASLTGGIDLDIVIDENINTLKQDIKHCLREGWDYVRDSDESGLGLIIPIQVLRSHPLIFEPALTVDEDHIISTTFNPIKPE